MFENQLRGSQDADSDFEDDFDEVIELCFFPVEFGNSIQFEQTKE